MELHGARRPRSLRLVPAPRLSGSSAFGRRTAAGQTAGRKHLTIGEACGFFVGCAADQPLPTGERLIVVAALRRNGIRLERRALLMDQ